MQVHHGFLLNGSVRSLHVSGCPQLSSVRPCRRALQVRAQDGSDAVNLAPKPELNVPPQLRPPPGRPTPPSRNNQQGRGNGGPGGRGGGRGNARSNNWQGRGGGGRNSADRSQQPFSNGAPQQRQQEGPRSTVGSDQPPGPRRDSLSDSSANEQHATGRLGWKPAVDISSRKAPAASQPNLGTERQQSSGARGPGPASGAPALARPDKFARRGPASSASNGGRGRGNSTQDGRRRKPSIQYSKVDLASRREARGNRRRDRALAREAAQPVRQDVFEVAEAGMSVEDLAFKLGMDATEVVGLLFMEGIMASVNQVLDRETVHLLVDPMEDVEVVDADEVPVEQAAKKSTKWIDEADADHLVPRPPVVTIMGHVDHGKTSLLDYVRKTKVVEGEAGGITQAIGAYTVAVPHDGSNSAITFVDTPGHEAFSAMRARGTKVTDIAVIVVAADDGVRPQTQEAISHARAAQVPIIIAINKVDKPDAAPDRVKQELADIGVMPEEWGGSIPMVPISAKHGQGVDDLLEEILLQADVAELVANPQRAARGTIIEAHLDKRKGAVATLLVQAGTLRVGDVVVAGRAFGKVKTLTESTGDVESATPSLAVQMSGLNAVPTAGDEFFVCADETEARKAAQAAEDAERVERLAATAGGGNLVTTKSWASMDEEAETVHRLNIILKTDASGTLEAVKAALSTLPQDSVLLRFLLNTASQITVSDVDLALASQAIILGFNTELTDEVQAAAREKGVILRSYDIIYELVDDVRAAMEGRLDTVEERTEIGQAEVRATFGMGNRLVAGCMVSEGMLKKNAFLIVTRGSKTVYEGPLTSLRRGKDDVKEVARGLECGIRVADFTGWKEGDKVTAVEISSKRRTLEEASVTERPQKVSAEEDLEDEE